MSSNKLKPPLHGAVAALTTAIVAVATLTPAFAASEAPRLRGDDALASFLKREALDRRELMALVLTRNPTVSAAEHSLGAALARFPQETALEDPRLSYSFAPLSVAGPVRFGQAVELSQMIPFPGKRGLRGEVAEAQTAAVREDLAAVRLRLRLVASMLFDDLFVVQRALVINDEHIALLVQLKKSAEAQYVVGRAAQQDPLQAEVELSHILHDKVVLESERDRIRAQLNGLLHRLPQEPLPPAPDRLDVPPVHSATSEQLQGRALQQRPELAGLRARLGGGEAAIRLARRGYLPDFMLTVSYNSMWMDVPHQFMAGVSLNIPLQLGSRSAAVDEAEAQLQGLRSEEQRLVDEIRVDVELAATRLREAHQLLHLYGTRLIPAAKDQLLAARAGFESGKNSFTTMVDAQKNLRTMELRAQTAVADVQRRQAELNWAIGQTEELAEMEAAQ